MSFEVSIPPSVPSGHLPLKGEDRWMTLPRRAFKTAANNQSIV
jgi:hypothetical protein